MTDEKKSDNPTGKAVRDTKGGTTDKAPAPNITGGTDPNQMQIHPGNLAVLTVKMLDEINSTLKRIALALEKANG